MSQMPPPDPYGQMPGQPSPGFVPNRPPPFSAAAIAGFVLSLLGCLGVTAVLGLIFGIVGIFTTRGGARRGFGLAVAALPISLVMGLFSLVVVFAMVAFGTAFQVLTTLPNLYDVNGNVVAGTVAVVRDACTDDFKAAVSEAQLAAWFQSVKDEHGSLTDLTPVPGAAKVPGTDRMTIRARGKFVDGEHDVAMTLQKVSPFSIKIDDIEIAGSSPRGSK